MPHEAFDSMLNQAGVIRASDVHVLFDIARWPSRSRSYAGTGSPLSPTPTPWARLPRSRHPATAWRWLTARSSSCRGHRCRFPVGSTRSAAEPLVDSVLTCFIPPLVVYDEEVVRAVREEAAATDKTVLGMLLGMHGVTEHHRCLRAHRSHPDRAGIHPP